MMNDEDRRRYDRAWNDPPMFTMDQLNKQPTSAVPLNKRYKYPIADQQLLNNQMYQPQQQSLTGGYMQNAYGQPSYAQNQYSQPQYAQNQLAYNQATQMNYPGSQIGLQQQTGYGYNQQQYAQHPQQTHSVAQQAYANQQTSQQQLANLPIVSQQPVGNQSLSNYQTSAYLPNTINPTSTAINPSLNSSLTTSIPNAINPSLGIQQQSQIPVSNSMMQPSAYATTMHNNQYSVNQYGQPQQQMYTQPPTTQQQYSNIQSQYQY